LERISFQFARLSVPTALLSPVCDRATSRINGPAWADRRWT
jgi:hypothetical protein